VKSLRAALECPACAGDLRWSERISCGGCGAEYETREGVAAFLTPNLERRDLWVEAESGLERLARENPELRRSLLEPTVQSLSPADRYFRSQLLEAAGDYRKAGQALESAQADLYTADYLSGMRRSLGRVVGLAEAVEEPIVDIASGRCSLVEQLAQAGRRVVASDFSPLVLRRARRRLSHLGLADGIDFLAFDARATPFREGSVGALTTHLGLSNIERPGDVLVELGRISRGPLLAICLFYREDDEPNAAAIRAARLETFLFRASALEAFARAGWDVEEVGSDRANVEPTPAAVVVEGARIDALPVAESEVEWSVLRATRSR
jgi:methyltransferase family protein